MAQVLQHLHNSTRRETEGREAAAQTSATAQTVNRGGLSAIHFYQWQGVIC
jgi:hypothetical protein